MRLSAEEFLAQPKKTITLIGMSGLGKTYMACMLARQGWEHYSCDEIIGRDFLAGDLDAPVTKEDLSPLSRFIGKLGDPAKGGLPLAEFRKRQKMYYDAECEALRRVGREIAGSHADFVNDSTGSLCEITDEALIDQVGRETLFIYIRANAEDEAAILQRAIDYPKPLFFPASEFDFWLGEYMKDRKIGHADEMDPDEFSRWVFPLLFQARLPKYRRLAEKHGITIASEDIRGVENEQNFTDLVVRSLGA
ncbi:MAG: hypothetical protein JWO78_2252 [Micavibrio sp.]|nr:hypothetical protein [Micavibrio sp.]